MDVLAGERWLGPRAPQDLVLLWAQLRAPLFLGRRLIHPFSSSPRGYPRPSRSLCQALEQPPARRLDSLVSLEVAQDPGEPRAGRAPARVPARGLEQGSVVQARAHAAGERVALVLHGGAAVLPGPHRCHNGGSARPAGKGSHTVRLSDLSTHLVWAGERAPGKNFRLLTMALRNGCRGLPPVADPAI